MKIGIHQYMDQLREWLDSNDKTTFMYSELPEHLRIKNGTMGKLKNKGYIKAVGKDQKTGYRIWKALKKYHGGYPSDEKLNKIAEALKAGKKITHITRDLNTNWETVKKVESGMVKQ